MTPSCKGERTCTDETKLSRPSDLVSVCLTSHDLHEIAARFLYRSVALEIGGPRDSYLAAFLNPRNIGLRCIRKLDIYLAEAGAKQARIDNSNFALRMILEFLPENTLREFSWHPWQPMSADNLVLLYKKQRELDYLEGTGLDRDPWPELQKLPHMHGLISRVRKIAIFPDCKSVLKLSGELLRRTKKLENLHLQTDFCMNQEHSHFVSAREINDSATSPGLMTSTLFAHLMPFENCTPLNLSTLHLQKVNLRCSRNTYARFINLPQLMHLTISNCPGADAFLAELCLSTQIPTGLVSLEFKHRDCDEEEGMDALDSFLCLINKLESLTIDVDNNGRLPNVDAITGHSKTLRQLAVHVADSAWNDNDVKEHSYNGPTFGKICQACTNLEELSVAQPDVPITADVTDHLSYWFQHLHKLRGLRTLQLTRFPYYKNNIARIERDVYVHLLGLHASRIFESASRRQTLKKLKIIAYGASSDTHNRLGGKNQAIFAKAAVPEILGGSPNAAIRASSPNTNKLRKEAMALQVSWADRRYIEPVSEILELDLGASLVAMPVTANGISLFGEDGWS